MNISGILTGLAAGALSLAGSAFAEDIRVPQGEYFQMGRIGGSMDSDPEYFWAHFLAAHESDDTQSSGVVMMIPAGGGAETEMVGTWTVDKATGAVTIEPGFYETTHCDSWPEYFEGETIDLTAPSEKNCWVGNNHAPYVSEMVYQGLR